MAKPFKCIRRGLIAQCVIREFCDGDTVWITVKCQCAETYHLIKLRIRGIDSWEPNSRNKDKAKLTADELNLSMKYKRGELYCYQTNSDRHGRAIGDIRINGKMLSDIIVDKGLGWYLDSKIEKTNSLNYHLRQ